MFDFERVNQEFQEEFDALREETRTLSDAFKDVARLPPARYFPHAHFGYLMAIMGRLDQYSTLWKGPTHQNQTQRMVDFLATFVFPVRKLDHVHSAVVQMFRHSLMHTGAFRFLLDAGKGVGYIWRVNFAPMPPEIEHYSVTQVEDVDRDRLVAGLPPSAGQAKQVMAVNLSIPLFVDNLYGGVGRYMHALRASEELQAKFMAAAERILVQPFQHRMPGAPPDTSPWMEAFR